MNAARRRPGKIVTRVSSPSFPSRGSNRVLARGGNPGDDIGRHDAPEEPIAETLERAFETFHLVFGFASGDEEFHRFGAVDRVPVELDELSGAGAAGMLPPPLKRDTFYRLFHRPGSSPVIHPYLIPLVKPLVEPLRRDLSASVSVSAYVIHRCSYLQEPVECEAPYARVSYTRGDLLRNRAVFAFQRNVADFGSEKFSLDTENRVGVVSRLRPGVPPFRRVYPSPV